MAIYQGLAQILIPLVAQLGKEIFKGNDSTPKEEQLRQLIQDVLKEHFSHVDNNKEIMEKMLKVLSQSVGKQQSELQSLAREKEDYKAQVETLTSKVDTLMKESESPKDSDMNLLVKKHLLDVLEELKRAKEKSRDLSSEARSRNQNRSFDKKQQQQNRGPFNKFEQGRSGYHDQNRRRPNMPKEGNRQNNVQDNHDNYRGRSEFHRHPKPEHNYSQSGTPFNDNRHQFSNYSRSENRGRSHSRNRDNGKLEVFDSECYNLKRPEYHGPLNQREYDYHQSRGDFNKMLPPIGNNLDFESKNMPYLNLPPSDGPYPINRQHSNNGYQIGGNEPCSNERYYSADGFQNRGNEPCSNERYYSTDGLHNRGNGPKPVDRYSNEGLQNKAYGPLPYDHPVNRTNWQHPSDRYPREHPQNRGNMPYTKVGSPFMDKGETLYHGRQFYRSADFQFPPRDNMGNRNRHPDIEKKKQGFDRDSFQQRGQFHNRGQFRGRGNNRGASQNRMNHHQNKDQQKNKEVDKKNVENPLSNISPEKLELIKQMFKQYQQQQQKEEQKNEESKGAASKTAPKKKKKPKNKQKTGSEVKQSDKEDHNDDNEDEGAGAVPASVEIENDGRKDSTGTAAKVLADFELIPAKCELTEEASIDPNHPLENIMMIAKEEDGNVISCIPKTFKELSDFKLQYPNAQPLIVKEK